MCNEHWMHFDVRSKSNISIINHVRHVYSILVCVKCFSDEEYLGLFEHFKVEFFSLSRQVSSPVGNLIGYFASSQAVKPGKGTRFKNGFNKTVIKKSSCYWTC